MKRVKIEVTITFKGDAWVEDDMPDLDAGIMSKVLGADTYCDGRHDFNQEMVSHGLNNQIKWAVREAVLARFESEIGRDALHKEHGKGGRVTSTQPLYRKLAEDWMEKNRYNFFVDCEPADAYVKLTHDCA